MDPKELKLSENVVYVREEDSLSRKDGMISGSSLLPRLMGLLGAFSNESDREDDLLSQRFASAIILLLGVEETSFEVDWLSQQFLVSSRRFILDAFFGSSESSDDMDAWNGCL